jgi:hypothetical protein
MNPAPAADRCVDSGEYARAGPELALEAERQGPVAQPVFKTGQVV